MSDAITKSSKKEDHHTANLNAKERSWIQEILNANRIWSDVDVSAATVIAECDCGECRTAYLSSPQNQTVAGSRGYIGRIEIRTDNNFRITVTLDQLDGRLSELYVNALDLSDDGSRPIPGQVEGSRAYSRADVLLTLDGRNPHNCRD